MMISYDMPFGLLSQKSKLGLVAGVLTFLTISVVNGQQADSSSLFTVHNMFYCNTFHPISKLWILSDSTAIGARRYNHRENHIKDIVLISRSGLILDSLSLSAAFKAEHDYAFMQIHNISPQTNNMVLIHSGRFIIPVSYANKRLSLTDTTLVQKRKEILDLLYTQHKDIYAEFVLFYKNLLIGYDRQKVKIKNDRIKYHDFHDDKNYPLFWVINTNDTGLKKTYINRQESVYTNTLYFDIKDWNQTWSRADVFEPYISVSDDQIYFSVTRANHCYAYHLNTGIITTIPYPAIKNGQSVHFYKDHISQNEYAIKRDKNGNFTVYLYSSDRKLVYPIRTFFFRPFAVVNNHAHFIQESKENKNNLLCHYLIPLKTELEKTKRLLPEVLVHD